MHGRKSSESGLGGGVGVMCEKLGRGGNIILSCSSVTLGTTGDVP